jgi:hypothetical protein
MATTIKLKSGSGAPLAGDLVAAEPAFDLTNKRLYTENASGTVIEVGTNPTSLTTGTFTSTGIDDNATSTAITIDSSENVGIGTASPAQPLEILKTNAGAVVPMLQLRNGASDAGSGTSIKFLHSTSSAATSGTCEIESIRVSGNYGALTFKTSGNTGVVTEHMRIYNGNVGIGTASPGAPLDVAGAIRCTTGFQMYDSGSVGRGIVVMSGDDPVFQTGTTAGTRSLLFKTEDTERMRIDSSGNLLVGKTSATTSDVGIQAQPIGRLYATRDGDVPLVLRRNTSDGNIAQFLKDGSTVGSIGTQSSRLVIGSGDTGLRMAADLNNIVPWNTTTNLLSDSAIDLGGVTQRFKDFYLSNNISLSNASTSAFLQVSTNILQFGTSSSDPVAFYSNNAEAMRIDTSGNLLVGRTNVTFGSGTNGAFTLASGRFLNEVSGDTCLALNRTDGTGTAAIVFFYRGNTAAGQINAAAGGTPAFASSSDIRLKNNVTDHESELANVMSLRPVCWDWKDEAKGSGEGFIAQELEQTAWADLVSEGDDGYKAVSGLGAVETRLIKALQEAVTRIETLEAEVAALKGA